MRGASFRKAVAVSVGVHVVLAVGLVALLRWEANRPHDETHAASFDTRADVRLEFAKEAAGPSIEMRPPREEVPSAPTLDSSPASGSGPTSIDVGGPPRANSIAIPRSLPPEMLGLLKKSQSTSTSVEHPPISRAPVQPAAGTTAREKPGPAWSHTGSPIHGPLGPKQTIVYVLDASGSMGESGKYDAARGALIATLRLQPQSVRFQVVIYSGTAALPLPGSPGECLPATASNIARTIEVLHAQGPPAGRSTHVAGLRAALNFKPDLVLIFTDADDLPATAFRGVVKQAARPAAICVAKVTAAGVETPAEVK